jgi:hypothetical protein
MWIHKVAFLIKLAVFWASGPARVKLHLDIRANRRISIIEPQNFEVWFRFAQPILNKTEYITSTFDIFYSIFDI